jgi:hypothetical protein
VISKPPPWRAMICPILPQPSSPILIMINRLWVPLVKCCAHEMKYARDFRYNKLRPDFSDFSVFPVFISLTLFIRVRSIDPVVLKKWQKHPK